MNPEIKSRAVLHPLIYKSAGLLLRKIVSSRFNTHLYEIIIVPNYYKKCVRADPHVCPLSLQVPYVIPSGVPILRDEVEESPAIITKLKTSSPLCHSCANSNPVGACLLALSIYHPNKTLTCTIPAL